MVLVSEEGGALDRMFKFQFGTSILGSLWLVFGDALEYTEKGYKFVDTLIWIY